MNASGTLTCPRCGTETPWPTRCDCKTLGDQSHGDKPSVSADELDLGDGHRIVFAEYEGEPRVGGNVKHPPVEGKCSGDGWISFEGRAWARQFKTPLPSWKVESENPLTLSPSILCRACGDHGHIRNGKWERA